MALEISKIQDQQLRHAAEVADLKGGNNAYNGQLDTEELSVFIKEAVNSGADRQAIADLANQVGFSVETDKEAVKSMETLNKIQKLEKEIKYQEDLLKQRDDERNAIKSSNNRKNWAGIGCILGGMAAGAAGGAYIGSLICPGAGTVLGGIVGGLIGFASGKKIGHSLFGGRERYNDDGQYSAIVSNKNDLVEQVIQLKSEL